MGLLRPRGASLAFLMMALLSRLQAGSSVTAQGSAGPGSWGAEASAASDLDEKGFWNLEASYGYSQVTQTSAPSRTQEAGLALNRGDNGPWLGKAGVDYANDDINHIFYCGPSLGLSYSGGGHNKDRAWSLDLGASIYGYSVSLGSLSGTSATKAGVAYTLVNDDGSLSLTQFHPSLTLGYPLFSGLLSPTAAYGHYFYNKDPSLAAAAINRRFSGGGSGSTRAFNLSQGLYYDNWNLGLDCKLPADLSLSLNYGQSLMISPFQWLQEYGAELAAKLSASFSASLAWSETAQGGTASPQYSASLTMNF
jgi:hypothetical protein